MSINVIDNFEVGVSKPIDNRFVVGPSLYYTNRDFISYKYTGLRIWDLNDNLPYVWTGATWSNETTSGTVNGSGTSGYISKFVGSSPTSTIGNSVIFESGGNVGIGTTTFGSPIAKLQVNGIIRTTVGGFYGNGANITSINGANITTGSIPVNRLTNGSINQLLSAGSGSAVWVNPSSVTVGNATNAANVNIITDNVNSNTQYIPFVSSTGNQQIKINTANSIRINPSNGHVGIGGSARATPRLYVNGGASIGTTSDPSSNGLIVGGNVRLSGNVGIGLNPGTNRLEVSGTTKTTQIRLGTHLNISEATSGNYLYLNNTNSSSNIVGIFFQHTSGGFAGARSLYMDSSGNLITGGNSGAQFQNFRLNSTQFRVGNDVTGTPLIRVGNNTTPTAPSYTFFGNDQCGMYREAQDVLAFCTTGTKRVTINSSGRGVFGFGLSIPNEPETAGTTRKVALRGNNGEIVWSSSNLNAIVTSDVSLKKNIKPISPSIFNKVLNIDPVTFEWIDNDGMLNKGVNIGLIAQEVQAYYPDAINRDVETDNLSINPLSMISILLGQIKNQNEEILKLSKRIEDLES
jgi:hypothetical protein